MPQQQIHTTLITKTTVALYEAALSYHTVRGLYFPAVFHAAIIIISVELKVDQGAGLFTSHGTDIK